MAQLIFRQAREEDHAPIVAAIQTWWSETRTPDEARELSLLLPRLFLQHFAATSLILEGRPEPGRPATAGAAKLAGEAPGTVDGVRPGGLAGAAEPGGVMGRGAGGEAHREAYSSAGEGSADGAAVSVLPTAGDALRTNGAGPVGSLAGFLIGFHSPDRPGTAYIHFVGVHPALRQHGIARQLYERFFARAIADGRQEVRAIVSPANKPSIAFHRSMGFAPDGGDYESDGVPVYRDYDGPGHDRISFRRVLSTSGTARG